MHGYDVGERQNARDPFEELGIEERTQLEDAIDAELARREDEPGVIPEAGTA